MAKIEYQELIDLDGLRIAISEAKTDYKAWIDESTRLNALLLASSQALTNQLLQLRGQAGAAGGNTAQQQQLLALSQQLATQLASQTQATTALNTVQQQNAGVVTNLSTRLNAVIAEYTALDRSVAGNATRSNQLSREMVTLQGQLNRSAAASRTAATATGQVTGQYNTLNRALNDARRDLRALDDAFDSNTGELNRNNAEAVRLAGIIQRNSTSLQALDRQMNVWSRNVGNYSSALQGLGNQGFQSLFGRLTPFVSQLTNATTVVDAATGAGRTFTATIGGMGGSVAGAEAGVSRLTMGLGLTALAFGAIGGAVIGAGKEIFETTAKFEKYNAILATTLGSTQAGEAAFAMIQQFAAKTNFSVDELTDAYIKLANRGLRPGQAELAKIADVANATGKPFGQLVEAINDVNNQERWNEIGIRAKTNGDKVSLTFKGVTQTVARTEDGVLKAVAAFGELPGVVGITAKISGTLDGQLSNLGDSFDNLKVIIGNELKPAFGAILTAGSELITLFIALWKGSLPFREALGLMVDTLGDAFKAVWSLIKNLASMDERMGGTMGVVRLLGATISFAFKLITSGIIATVGAVTAVAGSFDALLNKAKQVSNYFGSSFKINPNATFDNVAANWDKVNKRIRDVWDDTKKQVAKPGPVPPAPKIPKPTVTDSKEAEKARKAARDLTKAEMAEELSDLAKRHEDGLISERTYLAQRLGITLAGLDQELALVKGKGKEQIAERLKINKQKIDAERDYKNDLLKYETQESSTGTANQLAGISQQKEDGTITEADYIAKRRAITIAGITERQQLLFLAGRQETEAYKKTETEILNAESEYTRARNKLQEDSFKKALDATKDALAEDLGLVKSGAKDRLADLEQAYDAAQNGIKLAVTRRQISETDGEEQLYDLKLQYISDVQRVYDAAAETETARITERIAKLRAEGKTEVQIAAAVKLEKEQLRKADGDKKDADDKADLQRIQTKADQELKIEQQKARIKKQTEETYYQAAGAAVSGYFEVTAAFRQQDLDLLEKNKERELTAAGDNANAKDAINKRYARQEAELKRKQAIADKEQAAFNIILSTGQAIMKTYAEFGFPIGIPLAIAQGVLGAIQLATVIAKPIPQFFRGTSDAPEGPAWVGEQGYELIESKRDGKSQYRLAAEKQITYLNRHDRVYTHQETKRMLTVNQELATEVRRAPGGSMYQSPVVVSASSGLTKADLMDAFKSQPVYETHFDEGEMKRYIREKDSRTRWLNDYFSLPKAKR